MVLNAALFSGNSSRHPCHSLAKEPSRCYCKWFLGILCWSLMVFGLLWEFKFALFLPTSGFLAVFLLWKKSDELGGFNTLNNETLLWLEVDNGQLDNLDSALALWVELVKELILTSNSYDDSQQLASLLALLRPSSITSLSSLSFYMCNCYIQFC